MDVIWLTKQTYGISQVYSSGVEFCFISEKNEQCHPFVFCKDFLQDAVMATLHDKTASIYGFSYSAKKNPKVCLDATQIAVADKNGKDFETRVAASLEFVNYFAKKLHIKPTTYVKVNNPPSKYEKSGVYVTKGSRMWMNAPPLLSMYSLLLRGGLAHTTGKNPADTWAGLCDGSINGYGREDGQQFASSKTGIESILKIGYRKFFYIDSDKNYPAKTSISTMHNNCGIVGFSSSSTTSVVPYWHRKSLAKKLSA